MGGFPRTCSTMIEVAQPFPPSCILNDGAPFPTSSEGQSSSKKWLFGIIYLGHGIVHRGMQFGFAVSFSSEVWSSSRRRGAVNILRKKKTKCPEKKKTAADVLPLALLSGLYIIIYQLFFVGRATQVVCISSEEARDWTCRATTPRACILCTIRSWSRSSSRRFHWRKKNAGDHPIFL